MKNIDFYSREQLMTMPLIAIRGIDIETPEQQVLVQDVVNIKLASLPAQRPVYRKDVPDIKTQEDEAHWQAIIDRRTKIAKGEVLEDEEEAVEPIEVPSPEFKPEEQPLAEPTGEGEPVTFASGVVSPQLQTQKPKRQYTKRT